MVAYGTIETVISIHITRSVQVFPIGKLTTCFPRPVYFIFQKSLMITTFKPSNLTTSIVTLLSLGSLTFASPSQALNLDFRTWDTFGDVLTQKEKAELTNAFSDGFDDLDNFNISGDDPIFAFDLEFDLGFADGALGFDAGDTSAITKTFTVQDGDVLNFDWNFLTNHDTSESRNDFAFVAINNSITLLADTNSSLSSPGKQGFSRHTGFNSFSHTFSEEGVVTITLGVVDVLDDNTSSGLTAKTIPEPLTYLGVTAAIGFGSFFKWKMTKKDTNANNRHQTEGLPEKGSVI